MKNAILVVLLVLILGLAAWYVYRAKKKGRKCIGCPSGASCEGNCPGCGQNKL